MTSKVQPAADYWIIDVKDYWTIDQGNLGTRLCHSTKRELAASRVYKFERRKYFEWIIKQLASVDNTLLDLQNSSYPTQPHSIIAKYRTNLFARVLLPRTTDVNVIGQNTRPLFKQRKISQSNQVKRTPQITLMNDYMNTEPTNRFKNAIMNWLLEKLNTANGFNVKKN